MNKKKYVLENIQKLFDVQGCLVDNMGEQFFSKRNNTVIKSYFGRVQKYLCKSNDVISMYSIEPNIYFFHLLLPDNLSCVFGPIGGEKLTEQQKRAFLFQSHIKDCSVIIPRFSLSKMITLISTIYYMLSGEIIQEQTIKEINIENLAHIDINDKEIFEYQMYKFDEVKGVAAYRGEMTFFQYIEEGNVNEIRALYLDENIHIIEESLENIGAVSISSDYKQVEYMVVVMIALAARAAMKGGIRTEKCYNLSDLYLQKLSECKNIIQIREIGKQAMIKFAEIVKEKKECGVGNILVEQCKDYIARRIFDSFTIEHMSNDLAINRTYLSSLFTKETGMSISAYMQKEKLDIARNMLEYSDRSIGQIAEYLQFSSPGRFGRYFKRQYQMTPREYRRIHKQIEFIPYK